MYLQDCVGKYHSNGLTFDSNFKCIQNDYGIIYLGIQYTKRD